MLSMKRSGIPTAIGRFLTLKGGQGIYGCEELHYGLGFVGGAFEEWQGH